LHPGDAEHVSRVRLFLAFGLVFGAAATVEDVYAASHGVSGRSVSNVRYALSAQGDVSSLRFTLVPAAPHVRVRVSPRAAWRSCDVAGVRVRCALGVPVSALRGLEIAV
jgi:hypothetical protein